MAPCCGVGIAYPPVNALVAHRPRITLALLTLPWLAAIAVAVRASGSAPAAAHRAELATILMLCSLLIVAGGSLMLLQSTKPAHRRALGVAASLLAPLAALIALQTDGPRSVAFIAACICAVGAGAAVGWPAVLQAAIGTLGVTLIGSAAHDPRAIAGDAAFGGVMLCAVTMLPYVFVRRAIHRTSATALIELPSFSRAPAEPGAGAGTSPSRATPTHLSADGADGSVRTDALGRYLRQVRDALGVSDAVFWRMTRGSDSLTPIAAASEAVEPWHQATAQISAQLQSVQSAARVTHFDRGADGVIAAIAVAGTGNAGGVLTVHARRLSMPKEALGRWMPRFADNLGLIAQLLETQSEYARQNRQTQALLNASQLFQQQRSIDSLGQSICDSALTVTGGARAALIRWYPETSSGVVQSVTSGHYLTPGTSIVADSLIGQLCEVGRPQVWEDAQHLERVTPVFSEHHPLRHPGSLGIVPLKQTDAVSGAIVVESDVVGGVQSRDIRNVRLLGAIASVSLETVWQLEEATRRARTDALTGLSNRRAFEEALARAVAEADRFGHNVGLVICDLDNFKRVNDLYGHDVGDHVLRSIAASLSTGIRGVDLVARYGGEEFVLLLGKADVAMAWEVAERMRAAVEAKTIGVGEHLVHVTASFGVAAYPETARLGEDLFPAADRALYAAKREGRNCVRFARPLGSEPAAEGEV